MGSQMPDRSNHGAGPAEARRALLLRLLAAFPTLPVPVVMSAVDEYERAILFVGDGRDERETLESAARNNLASVLAMLAPAGGRKAADPGGVRVDA